MSMRVLIADPDWRFAEQASTFLEAHAHLVVRQPRAKQAMEIARTWRPDLIIVSEELTGNGLLGKLHSLPDRPAVLLTGWMDRYARVWKAWQRGGHELLIKPVFTRQNLHAAIVIALENAAAGEPLRRPAISA